MVAQMVKCLPTMWKTWVRSLGREDPLEKEMATTPVLLPGKSHGWRSLVGYSPRGHKELDMTERLSFPFLHYSYLLHSTCFYSSIGGERAAPFKFQIQDVCVQSSCVWLFGTLWTVAHQAPLSMGFLRLGYWSGLTFPFPVDLQDPWI